MAEIQWGDDPQEFAVRRDLLAPLIEQPEPSTKGDWYIVPLETLIREGYTHIEVHFGYKDNDDDTSETDMLRLTKDPNWHSEIL